MRSWALALMHAAPEASGEATAIEWVAPAECPSEGDVRARAEALAAVSAELLRGRGIVAATSFGYALELSIDGASEHFVAPSCEQLADLTALMIAVAADPVAVATQVADALVIAEPGVPPPEVVDAAESPRQPTVATPTALRTTRRRPPWHAVIAAHALAGVAELPRVDAGVDLAVALEGNRFSLQARGFWLSAREAPIPDRPRARVRITAANASLRACGVWRWAKVDLLGCGGIELGGAIGRPVDTSAASKTSLWIAALASVGVRGWVHPRIAFELGADLLVALRRPRFGLSIAPDDTVDAGIGGARGWAGLAVRLGPLPRTRR